jgi:hypothetical protein
MNLFARFIIVPLILSYFGVTLNAQITQTIRGTVTDKNSGIPLIGATVVLLNYEPFLGTISDQQGNFRLVGVPLGRQGIQVDFLGLRSQGDPH